MNPEDITPYLFKILFNIILPPPPPMPLKSPHPLTFFCISQLFHACYMSKPPHPTQYDRHLITFAKWLHFKPTDPSVLSRKGKSFGTTKCTTLKTKVTETFTSPSFIMTYSCAFEKRQREFNYTSSYRLPSAACSTRRNSETTTTRKQKTGAFIQRSLIVTCWGSTTSL